MAVVGDRRGAVELLERDEALAALENAYSLASTKSGRVQFVTGEAGVGKTVLVRAFCDSHGEAHVLWGACDALFTPRPLGPIVQIAQVTGGRLENVVASAGTPHDVADALVRELGPRTILVLDDLHWADEATLDVLRLLVRRLDDLQTLIVATFRDDELDTAHPLRLVLGETATTRAVDRLALSLSRVRRLPTSPSRTASTKQSSSERPAATRSSSRKSSSRTTSRSRPPFAMPSSHALPASPRHRGSSWS